MSESPTPSPPPPNSSSSGGGYLVRVIEYNFIKDIVISSAAVFYSNFVDHKLVFKVLVLEPNDNNAAAAAITAEEDNDDDAATVTGATEDGDDKNDDDKNDDQEDEGEDFPPAPIFQAIVMGRYRNNGIVAGYFTVLERSLGVHSNRYAALEELLEILEHKLLTLPSF